MPENLIDPSPRTIHPDLDPVGALAFGCWRFTNPDIGEGRKLIETALDLGMNLIDNADVYGFDWGGDGFGHSERLLGEVLASAPGLRDRMVLATKGGIMPGVPYDQSAKYLRAACEASLQRLNTDTVDLYQIHRPDLFAHPAEVAATLTELHSEGKIRAVGVSNFTVPQYDALRAHLDIGIATSQPEYSAVVLDPLRDGMFDACMRDGVTPMAWSPLGGGRLVAQSADGVRPELIAVLDGLAEREAVDRATIAYAFVLAHPSRPIAILGTQNPARLEAATRVTGVTLTRADVYAIVEASEGIPLP